MLKEKDPSCSNIIGNISLFVTGRQQPSYHIQLGIQSRWGIGVKLQLAILRHSIVST